MTNLYSILDILRLLQGFYQIAHHLDPNISCKVFRRRSFCIFSLFEVHIWSR